MPELLRFQSQKFPISIFAHQSQFTEGVTLTSCQPVITPTGQKWRQSFQPGCASGRCIAIGQISTYLRLSHQMKKEFFFLRLAGLPLNTLICIRKVNLLTLFSPLTLEARDGYQACNSIVPWGFHWNLASKPWASEFGQSRSSISTFVGVNRQY